MTPAKMRETAEQVIALAEAEREARAAAMPTEREALSLIHGAVERLKDLGWRDAIYCPKDGTEFEAIEAGSTVIHRCIYEGKWPDGRWWILAAHDLWPSRPILYRAIPAAHGPGHCHLAHRAARLALSPLLKEQRSLHDSYRDPSTGKVDDPYVARDLSEIDAAIAAIRSALAGPEPEGATDAS